EERSDGPELFQLVDIALSERAVDAPADDEDAFHDPAAHQRHDDALHNPGMFFIRLRVETDDAVAAEDDRPLLLDRLGHHGAIAGSDRVQRMRRPDAGGPALAVHA